MGDAVAEAGGSHLTLNFTRFPRGEKPVIDTLKVDHDGTTLGGLCLGNSESWLTGIPVLHHLSLRA